jgi:uncharacterized membrane protein YbhN (UPF0104 family)
MPSPAVDPPLAAELGDSFRAFFDAAGQFFESLAAIHWLPLLIALTCHGLYLSLRTRVWFNALRAAYPDRQFAWREIWAAEVAGNGVSSVVPAHGGGILRLYLGHRSIPGSSYPTVGSSFLVSVPFDIAVGSCILIYGFANGIFPRFPELPSLNAFDLSLLAEHPRFAIFVITVIPILMLVAFAVLSVRVREFWAHVRQGITMLRDRDLYIRGAVRIQVVAWAFRFASIWFLLEAFRIGGSIDGVLSVLAVQGIASLIPFTPQGAGVQQALLVHAFAGAATGATVAAYSVGQQVAIAGFNALFGLVALAIVFRTTDWRGLLARGRAEQDAQKRGRQRRAEVED